MKSEIDQKLKAKNIKPTPMRQLVLKMLLEEQNAMSLPEIEQKFDKADRSTIYRTLQTFQEHYLVHAIEDGSGSLRYAVCEDDCTCEPHHLHLHFLCMRCNRTFCLHNYPVQIPQLPETYQVTSANFVIKGICPDCHT